MKLLTRLEKSFSFWFLLIISVVFFLLRLPSLFEPYWYGDEGIYQAVGMLIRSGESLYSGAWDNKPPLLLLFYALFNSDQFIIRGISLIFGLISIWFFYFLAKKLFPVSKSAVIIPTIIYVLVFGTRLIEGNIANSENFMILPILAAVYLIFSAEMLKKSRELLVYFSSGILMSIAFLIKIVAVFDFMAVGYFLLISPQKSLREKFTKQIIPFTLGFSIPVLITFTYFFFTDHFKDFLNAMLLSNVGYVGKENALIIPQGFLYFKSIILAGFLLVAFQIRDKINKHALFILIWFGFSLFDAFFSQRPYTHYLIMLLPSFCLMIGAIIQYQKERLALFTVLVLGFLSVAFIFDFKGEIVKYYSNFIDFTLNKKDITSYQSFFDRNTPRDYELARYIRANTGPNDTVFIWGDNAMVYKLADKTPLLRYTVAYHITNFPPGVKNMKDAIEEKKPKFIILIPNDSKFPLSLNNYNEKINIRGAQIYEKIF